MEVSFITYTTYQTIGLSGFFKEILHKCCFFLLQTRKTVVTSKTVRKETFSKTYLKIYHGYEVDIAFLNATGSST